MSLRKLEIDVGMLLVIKLLSRFRVASPVRPPIPVGIAQANLLLDIASVTSFDNLDRAFGMQPDMLFWSKTNDTRLVNAENEEGITPLIRL